jgi:hypothetical protein
MAGDAQSKASVEDSRARFLGIVLVLSFASLFFLATNLGSNVDGGPAGSLRRARRADAPPDAPPALFVPTAADTAGSTLSPGAELPLHGSLADAAALHGVRRLRIVSPSAAALEGVALRAVVAVLTSAGLREVRPDPAAALWGGRARLLESADAAGAAGEGPAAAQEAVLLIWSRPLQHAEASMRLRPDRSFRAWMGRGRGFGWTDAVLEAAAAADVDGGADRLLLLPLARMAAHPNEALPWLRRAAHALSVARPAAAAAGLLESAARRELDAAAAALRRTLADDDGFLVTERALVPAGARDALRLLGRGDAPGLVRLARDSRTPTLDGPPRHGVGTRAAVGGAPAGPPRRDPPRREALATILTGDDPDYLEAAMVMGSTFRTFDDARAMLLLATPLVPPEWRGALESVGWEVRSVDVVEEFWWGAKGCASNVNGHGVRWGRMMSKLRYWEQTDFARLLHVDADAVVTAPVGGLFALPGGAGKETGFERARDGRTHLNAGVISLRPDEATFARLLARGAGPRPRVFHNEVDCTEQALMNEVFRDDAVSLPTGRADVAYGWAAGLSAEARRGARLGAQASDPAGALPAVVHWITIRCKKPWRVRRDPRGEVPWHGCDQSLYAYWSRVHARLRLDERDDVAGFRAAGFRAAFAAARAAD